MRGEASKLQGEVDKANRPWKAWVRSESSVSQTGNRQGPPTSLSFGLETRTTQQNDLETRRMAHREVQLLHLKAFQWPQQRRAKPRVDCRHSQDPGLPF